MQDVTGPVEDRRPILFIVVGRQRVGKTTFLNTTVQFVRGHGGTVVVWNADTMNTTYNLSQFSADVLQPASPGVEDVKSWLEERFGHLVQHRYDAMLDIGGGETPLARLVEEVPIVNTLERLGIRVVLVHVVGPETADLDYLARFMAEKLLSPEATLIVLNKGLILTGRSANVAFANVQQHRAFLEAAKSNAQVVLMPKLSCMSQVTDRHLTFADAMNGVIRPGMEFLSFFDQERVSIWWKRELPPFFGMIPPLWLPAMPGFMHPALGQPEQAQPLSGKKRSGTDG